MTFVERYSRFFLFFATFGATTAVLASRIPVSEALLAGFDAGAIVFMAALVLKMRNGSPESMRQRSAESEPSHAAILAIAATAVGVINVAVGVEVSSGSMDTTKLALTAATLLLAWLFGNVLFAIHYAHVYYLEADGELQRGMIFPGDEAPDFWDFTYIAFGIGMSFVTSDVEITAKKIRRVVVLHGLIAFVFNICVVALTVSLVGDAIKG